MKRVFRVLGILTGVILLLLITVPLLFKSRIETMVKETVNREIEASVDWQRFSLSLFRGFPQLSVNLHQASVVGLEEFNGDTLVSLGRFEVRVNPFSAIRKNLEVKSVILDRPLINGLVLEDGRANWDIIPETEEEPEEEPEAGEQGGDTGMSVSLKKFSIREGRIYYRDRPAGIDAAMEGFNLELAGDFSLDQTEMELRTNIGRINVKMGGIRYLRDAVLDVTLLAGADMADQIFTLRENEIRLNGLILGSEGEVRLLEDGAMDLDLKFHTGETSFQTLLSMVPAIYLSDFESLEARGAMQLEGSVSGLMKDSILPDALLSLQVSEGYFSYPDLRKEVSEVEITLFVDYKGSDMDATTVDLERFHLMLGGNPFDMKVRVSDPVSDMKVTGMAVGMIDFSTLQDVIPLEETSLSGRLDTDISWDTRLSYIEQERYEEVELEGGLSLEGFKLEMPEMPVPVDLQRLQMTFTPRIVELVDLDLKLGSSDLQMRGELSNFIPYLFSDQTVTGALEIFSGLLDVNELMPEEAEGPEEEAVVDTLSLPPPDSVAEPIQMKIPADVQFALSLDMRRVSYDQILLENILGRVGVSGGIASLENLSLEVIEGAVKASGTVDTRGEMAEVDLDLDVSGVDIPSAYSTFLTVKRLAPMARYCKGTANVKMQYRSLLDAGFSPLYGTINGKGRLYTKGLQFYNTRSFVQLSELLKNEKFSQMAPDELDIRFVVADGRVQVDPFEIDFDDSRIMVSGSHGIDQTMDYLLDMSIAKSDLGGGARDLMQGIGALAAGAGLNIQDADEIKVKARIRGTFKEPKITTDLSGNLSRAGETVKETVEQAVKEKVEEVEEEVREEAGQEAEKLISDAEKEKERLVGEAREAGEKLVKEAELQGENLMEEAGNNPIKQVAARRAAQELKDQAEKQSNRLIREAEEKGDALIEQAREKAGRI